MKRNSTPLLATIIAGEIEAQGLTVREAAEMLDVSYQAVDFWRRGEQQPGTDTLIRMLIKGPTPWAKKFAATCLHARYPGVFIRLKPNSN